MIITSSANPRIKHIRKLYDRKYREACQQFFMEGLRIVAQAVEEGVSLVTLIVSEPLLTSDFGWDLVAQQRDAGTEVLMVSPDIFRKISLKEGPQGLAAVGEQRWFSLSESKPGESDFWIALDRIQDPGNLGTVMRTGDAVGAAGLILLDHSTDPYDPAALRASMGAAFGLKLVRTSGAGFADWKNREEMFLLGTSDKSRVHYRDFPYPGRMTVIMGSEREGLQADLLAVCDAVVSIPMTGKNDSLNIAVAAGVVCYEYFEQNRRGTIEEAAH